jgi:hypothetical protein
VVGVAGVPGSLADILRSGMVSNVEVRGNVLAMVMSKDSVAKSIIDAVDPRLRKYVRVNLVDGALEVVLHIPDSDLKEIIFSGVDEKVRGVLDLKVVNDRVEILVRLA